MSILRFSSRWYLFARKNPYALSEASRTLPLKRFQCSSDWQWPSLVPWRKIVWRFLCPRLSPPVDRWCHVLGFVPAGTRSFSTLWIFREASHLWGLLFAPVYLLGHFPSLRHVRDTLGTQRETRVFQVATSHGYPTETRTLSTVSYCTIGYSTEYWLCAIRLCPWLPNRDQSSMQLHTLLVTQQRPVFRAVTYTLGYPAESIFHAVTYSWLPSRDQSSM